jgi:cytochrome oxidase Cu insertion factor (SCO1/SenC/PrrC family)
VRRAAIVVFAVTLAIGVGAWAHEKRDQRKPAASSVIGEDSLALSVRPSLSVIASAPDFALRDPGDKVVRLSDARGQVALVAFIYTSCTTACPILGHQMATLQKRLKAEKLLPGRVMLFSVTVDPARDSAATLARYAAALGADPAGWVFLRDSPQDLAPVLGAYQEWTKTMPDGEVDHPARVYLIDAGGRIREIYSLAFFDPRQALIDVRALVGEGRK